MLELALKWRALPQVGMAGCSLQLSGMLMNIGLLMKDRVTTSNQRPLAPSLMPDAPPALQVAPAALYLAWLPRDAICTTQCPDSPMKDQNFQGEHLLLCLCILSKTLEGQAPRKEWSV